MSYSESLALYNSINSRDNLRETLDGHEGVVVATLTQFSAPAGTALPSETQDATDTSTKAAVPKNRPPASVFSDMSFSDSVITFDRKRYPVSPVPGV